MCGKYNAAVSCNLLLDDRIDWVNKSLFKACQEAINGNVDYVIGEQDTVAFTLEKENLLMTYTSSIGKYDN